MWLSNLIQFAKPSAHAVTLRPATAACTWLYWMTYMDLTSLQLQSHSNLSLGVAESHFIPVTLTLTLSPSYTNLTCIPRRCTCLPKINSLSRRFKRKMYYHSLFAGGNNWVSHWSHNDLWQLISDALSDAQQTVSKCEVDSDNETMCYGHNIHAMPQHAITLSSQGQMSRWNFTKM